jgi:ketosteroid isomerase-like protein
MHHGDLISQELMTMEKKYWNAIRDKDSKAAAALSMDPCVVVGAQGIAEFDSKSLRRMLQSATYDLKEFALEDVHVRKVSDDVVCVVYKVKETVTLDGKDLQIEAYDSSVWAWQNGKWVCAVHTESIAGDAFERH